MSIRIVIGEDQALLRQGIVRLLGDIAEVLVVTPHAVEKHVTNTFSKLGVATGAEDHRRVLAVLHVLRGVSGP